MESVEKPNEFSENIDAPVVRRRRRIVRHHVREKTPEPSKNGGAKQKYSDDESSTAEMTGGSTSSKKSHHRSQQRATDASTNTAATASPTASTNPLVETIDEPPNDVPSQPTLAVVKSAAMSAHRSKILSRRDRSIGSAAIRSQSTPRDESKANDSGITLLIKQAKRSLSSPRYVYSI